MSKKLSEREAWDEIIGFVETEEVLKGHYPYLCWAIDDLEFDGKISFQMWERLKGRVKAEAKRLRKGDGISFPIWANKNYKARIDFCKRMIKNCDRRKK